MKIAITARGPSPRSEIDRCFARSYCFLIYDLESKEWTLIDNNEIRAIPSKAGELACKLLEENGVNVLITGETGPKAFEHLTRAGIEIYHHAIGCAEDMLLAWSLQKLTRAKTHRAQGSESCLSGSNDMAPATGHAPKLDLTRNRYQGS